MNVFLVPVDGFNVFANPPPEAVTVDEDIDFALVLSEGAFGFDSAALAAASGPATITETVFDPATQSFMLEVVDVQTGNVISAAPVGAQLQFQALAQLMASAGTPAPAQTSGIVNIQA
jgi:hypothetical protein